MVNLAQARRSNALLSERTIPRTCVFVSGTSGIGKYTLAELVSLRIPIKAYVVGRKASEAAMQPVLEGFRKQNPQADLVWIKGEVSLLSEVQRVCNVIKGHGDSSIDFLCLTAGYAPFGGRNNTSDGLGITHTLEYYGRMLFTLHLLPLLRKSHSPCVLTVLAGSMLANKLVIDDLNLDKPRNFSGFQSQTQISIMNTLFLDRLSANPENDNINFIHNWPGSVDTGNGARYHKPSWTSPFPITTLLKPIGWIMGHDDKEAGERHLFITSSGRFGRSGPLVEGGKEKLEKAEKGTTGREGSGLFILNYKCDVSHNEKALTALRAKGQEEVWEETMRILGPFV